VRAMLLAPLPPGGSARAGLHLVCGACRHRSDASRLASTVRRLP
jgi:hypothetical protein